MVGELPHRGLPFAGSRSWGYTPKQPSPLGLLRPSKELGGGPLPPSGRGEERVRPSRARRGGGKSEKMFIFICLLGELSKPNKIFLNIGKNRALHAGLPGLGLFWRGEVTPKGVTTLPPPSVGAD